MKMSANNLSNVSGADSRGSFTSINLSCSYQNFKKVLDRAKLSNSSSCKYMIEKLKASQLNNSELTMRNAELLLFNRENEMIIENLRNNNFNLMMQVSQLQNEMKKINSENMELKELCLKQEKVLECIKNAFPSNFDELKVQRKDSLNEKKTVEKRDEQPICRRSCKLPRRCLITPKDATKDTDQKSELDARIEVISESFELDVDNENDLNVAIHVEDELENTVVPCEKSIVKEICEYSIENATGILPSHSITSYFENGIQEKDISNNEGNAVETNMKINISNSKTKFEESLDSSFFSKPKKKSKSIKPISTDIQESRKSILKENEPLEQLTNKQATRRVTFEFSPGKISELASTTKTSRKERNKISVAVDDVDLNDSSEIDANKRIQIIQTTTRKSRSSLRNSIRSTDVFASPQKELDETLPREFGSNRTLRRRKQISYAEPLINKKLRRGDKIADDQLYASISPKNKKRSSRSKK